MAKWFITKKPKASTNVWIQGQSQILKDSNDAKKINKLWDLSHLPFISSKTAVISLYILVLIILDIVRSSKMV